LGHIPVFIRGGSVLATQEMALTTRDARNTSWSIIVAPGVDGSATGSLYLDDGESVAPNATKLVTLTSSSASHGTLSINVGVSGQYKGLDLPLANVTFLGVQTAPSASGVTINGQSVGNGTYNSASKTFSITNLGSALGGKVWSGNWTLSA